MDVKKYLEDKNIGFTLHKHKAVYTCDGAEACRGATKGIHTKNIFIKNRKSKRFYLLIIPADDKLNLDALSKRLDDKIKFANENDLKEKLGATAGAVSPFGLINNSEEDIVVIIDRKILDSDYVSFHPNINTETLELKTEEFKKYLDLINNKIEVL